MAPHGAMAAGGRLPLLLIVTLAAVQLPSMVVGVQARTHANPIRKVVNMLKMLEAKTEEEGKAAKQIFDKYMCYCKQMTAQLSSQIDAANEKLPLLEASLKSAMSAHTQLTEDLKKHKTDRTEARDAVKTATALREKAAEAFAKESTSTKANIEAMGKAIQAIKKGMGGFLQTNAASTLRQLSISMNMEGRSRDLLANFLTGSDQVQTGGSGEITGILSQMKDDMEKDLAKLIEEENADKQSFDLLVSAKQKEISATTKDIEQKTGRVGDLAVEIATLKGDKEDTEAALAEDQKFQSNLKTTCENKKAKYDVYRETMSAEKVALADTIKILNDDDALELFKKTLPSASLEQQDQEEQQPESFLQVQDPRQKAAAMLRKGKNGDHRLALLVMAMKGKKVGLEAVVKKVETLIGVLDIEQKADDDKKAFCTAEIDKTTAEKKQNERTIADSKTVIAETSDTLTKLMEEIAGLVAGIKELDGEVTEQTALRKEKHADVMETLAANNAAKSLLDVAKKRLQKFYGSSLLQRRKQATDDEDDDQQSPDDDQQPQVVLLQQGHKEAAQSDMDIEKKTAAAGGVVAMLNLLQADLSKEINQLEAQDAQAQKDYEDFLKDSSKKRAIDSNAVADKEGSKAQYEMTLAQDKEALRGQQTELTQTNAELASLHGDCDWLLQNHELRKNARAQEKDSLQKAKAVLQGADYS